MIKLHEFNTRWWGKSAGVVTDAQFFLEPVEFRETRLREYEWVEFAGTLPAGISPVDLFRAGFFQSGTQVPFRIDLRRIEAPRCDEEYAIEFADAVPFAIAPGEMALFRHERFLLLPGAGLERVAERCLLLATDLLAASPATCLRIVSKGQTQGWFLSREQGGKLDLTLAMLSRNATLGGALLYGAACHAYSQMGHRIGAAGFSVTNTAVHNIYAQLGARFLEPRQCWMWLSPELR
jgi:hypothetical protein